jgi:hypothetical protein
VQGRRIVMKPIFRRVLLTALLTAIGLLLTRGSVLATTHCSLTSVTNNSSNDEVVTAYNVFSSTNGSNTFNFTFNLSCNGSGSTTLTIYFYGRTSSSYTEPYLVGPDGSDLTFELCVPGTGSCTNSSGTIWNGTNAYTISCTSPTACQTDATNVTGSVYALPQQNMYVGTYTQYSQTVYFSMAST